MTSLYEKVIFDYFSIRGDDFSIRDDAAMMTFLYEMIMVDDSMQDNYDISIRKVIFDDLCIYRKNSWLKTFL